MKPTEVARYLGVSLHHVNRALEDNKLWRDDNGSINLHSIRQYRNEIDVTRKELRDKFKMKDTIRQQAIDEIADML